MSPDVDDGRAEDSGRFRALIVSNRHPTSYGPSTDRAEGALSLTGARSRAPWSWLSHPTAAVAIIYGIGFVVVNFHLARYGEPVVDLLKARYIAAGLAYAVLAGIPSLGYVVTLHTWSESGKKDTKRKGWKRVLERLFLCVLILGSIFLAWRNQLLSYVSIQGRLADQASFFFTSALIAFNASNDPFWNTVDSDFSRRLTKSLLPSITCCGGLLWSLGTFATRLYPSIAPQYGGGAIGAVHVHLSKDADSAATRIAAGLVGLVDRGNGLTFVMSCENAASLPATIAVPSNQITLIEYVSRPMEGLAGEKQNVFISLGHRPCETLIRLAQSLQPGIRAR